MFLFSLIEKFRLHAQEDKADYLEKKFISYINRPIHEGSIPVSLLFIYTFFSFLKNLYYNLYDLIIVNYSLFDRYIRVMIC